MTLEYFKGYSELFRGCLWYSDGSTLTSDGYLANMVNTSLNGTISSAMASCKTGTDRFGNTNKLYVGDSGNTKYISTLPVANIPIGTRTIIAWVDTGVSQSGSFYRRICDSGTNTSTNRGISMFIGGNTSDGYVFFGKMIGVSSDYDGENVFYNTTNITGSGWRMISYTGNGGSVGSTSTLYIDDGGTDKIATGSVVHADGGTHTYPLYTHILYGGSQGFPNAIGEFLVFNRILTPYEIKTFYQLTKEYYRLTPTLKGNRLCEG